jgi:hypothetical protein
VIEADDDELYVMKFRGSGHGEKALIAELVAGEIGRALGLRIPEIVFVELDPALGPNEPNYEIRGLLKASVGLNLGLKYLPNAFAFNMLLQPPLAADLASDIVWFDAYVTNVDRTPRNVNLLLTEDELWLIDHGSSLYFHHDWSNYLERSRTPFSHIKEHTLLPFASEIRAAHERLEPLLGPDLLHDVVALVPDEWLGGEERFDSVQQHRQAYVDYLVSRLAASDVFVQEALHARARSL